MKIKISFLISLLTTVTVRSYEQKYQKETNLRRKLQDITCGQMLPEYPLTDISSIGLTSVGQKVMVSYNIQNDIEMVACTEMMCLPDEPCCNRCGSASKFDDIHLVTSSGGKVIGCGGTDCDYMDNCVYKDGDRVIVYGTVDTYGRTIVVDEHCIDFTYIPPDTDFGFKDPSMELQDPIVQDKEGDMVDDGICKELSGEFMIPDTIYCTLLLGVGVWNGKCNYISGCSDKGYTFFDTTDECQSACFPEEDEREANINNKIELEPEMIISRPENGTNYMPYEGIRACLTNTLKKDIYLPGCSVFTLNQGNTTYSQRECFWEGNAIQLPPGEEYCSDYELHFIGDGEYVVSSQYCRALKNTGDAPPVFEQDCLEILSMDSEMIEVSCPHTVDCMPMVDQNLWMACGYMSDSFIEECPNTLILF